jgi:hypothetical protein
MKKSLIKIAALSLLAFPLSAHAQLAGLQGLLEQANAFVSRLIPFVIGIAVLVFLWGVLVFITHAGDETARANGRQLMLWGIIGLFVMVSVWGLVRILGDTLNLRNEAPPGPQVPRSGGFGAGF